MRAAELNRLRVGRRSVLAGIGGVAAGLGVSMLGFPHAAHAADVQGPLTPWFGPGGPKAGAGLVWQHGLNLAITGPGADYGKLMSQGVTTATKLIAASGGPTIKLAISDHQSGLVPPAVLGVRRLISKDLIQTLGSSYGPATESLFPMIEQAQVTTFWSGGAGPGGINKPYVWTTMALFAVDPTPGGLAFMAKRFPSAKRLAVVGQQENGLAAVNEMAPRIWPQVSGGGQIVTTELTNIGTRDFSSLVARVKNSKPDVVFSTVFGDDQGYFIKQLREAGITAPLLNIDLSKPGVPNIAGAAIAQECYLAIDGYFPENPNPYNRLFVDTYKAAYGVEPEYFAANFFEATNIIWTLIGRILQAGDKPGRGPAFSESIIKHPSFPSVYGGTADQPGVMTFDKDHTVIKPIGVFQIGEAGSLTKLATIKKGSTVVDPA
jgi:branched-chain amino acid transport system substrate-binding protein